MTKDLNQISIGEEKGSHSTVPDNSQHQQHHQRPDSKQLDVKIEYNSNVPEARRQTKLIISVKEKSGPL
jgi:hypothetical protein